MRNPTNIYQQLLSFIVMLLIPVVLILGAVRLMLNPWFLEFEYHTPNFPPDEFGFTFDERMRYARLELDYITNDAGISFLGDLHFPQGQMAPPVTCQEMTDCTKLYTDRELRHMVDVKNTLKGALNVWYISIATVLALGVLSWRGRWFSGFRRAVSRGGWLTVILIVVIFAFVLFAFDLIFVVFHNVFFAPGTWTFYSSDTLIRITPERFWRDTFLMVGGLSAVFGIIVGLVFRERKKKI